MEINAYIQNILEQPAALADTLHGLQSAERLDAYSTRLAGGQLQQVILTGMGSSFHALHPLHYRLVQAGVRVQMLETSELIHHAHTLLDRHNLILAVSQSGQSAEVVALLEQVKGKIPVIGITNQPENPLAHLADTFILLHAGDEYSVSTKTYLATLAALAWVGDELLGFTQHPSLEELQPIPATAELYLKNWEVYVEQLCQELAGAGCLFLCGRGDSLAAVGTGGLIIKESAHFPAEGMSSAAFRHGPLEMVSPLCFVLIFQGDRASAGLNEKLAADIVNLGGRAGVVHSGDGSQVFTLPAVSDTARPILEFLPVEMTSLALARLHDHIPGVFQKSGKVQKVE